MLQLVPIWRRQCPSVSLPEPTSWEHGAGGCSRQLFRNDTIREFIGVHKTALLHKNVSV